MPDLYNLSIVAETAINVGCSCQLINDNMEVLVVDGHIQEQVDKQIQKCLGIISGSVEVLENDRHYANEMQSMNVINVR